MPAEGIGIPSGNPRQKNTQSYLLALVCFQVSGSYGFIPIFGDFFYPLLTLLLHLFHLIDALAQVIGELPLQVSLVLLKLENILMQLAVILLQGLELF